MNPFTFDTSDFQFLLDSIGETVTIDNVSKKCIVQNGNIGDYEEKYIYTLDSIQRGNLIVYNRKNYIIASDVTEGKFYKKALMRKCNYEIVIEGQKTCEIVSYNVFGEPIEECHTSKSISVPAIIDKYTFKIDDFAPIRVPENQIIVTIREDDNTKQKFVANATFDVMGKTWKVVDVDLTRKGLLILTCELGI
ncbi:Ig domain-containing protein [Anoxybacillus flavithermus]|uniref:Ig domain-containing protein n=2 Tax=Anoxybacillus flavithermus TaxID=33934 RepID=UPI001868A456|nr:Ig domain-containing protein [Anoxybacillus flavithermus]MBE2927407.1 Ig domain-containing protein [Anoxybacillus flavithermus]MBE2946133.1 Ig domain-containing protein [Anoxybacillus flavithermus]MBE2948901.1 Ig domain-containing protein [Anoxybacillus flavithermus]